MTLISCQKRCKSGKLNFQEDLPAEDEIFIQRTFENLKILVEDYACIRLLFVSALFHPGNVQLDDDEESLVQHYEEKATILVYKHMMSK